MFVLFGWGKKTIKKLGIKNESCAVCGHQNFEYIRVITWFTLFFIPIIPYSFNYFVLCPQCKNGRALSKKEISECLNNQEAENITASESPFSEFNHTSERPNVAAENIDVESETGNIAPLNKDNPSE